MRKKKKKKVNYRLIHPYEDGTGRSSRSEPYKVLDHALGQWHPDLVDARIALAWRQEWGPDQDGRVTLGQCRKATDLDRELKDYDAVIVLNRDVWEDAEFTDAQKRALLDHELCHLELVADDAGDPVHDERGRLCYRIRKHDIEEFRAVVARHGTWKADLEAFARTLLQQRDEPLYPNPEAAGADQA